MSWLRSILLPIQGTAYARDVDGLFSFLVGLSVFFFLLIAGLLVWFVTRYRRRRGDESTPHLSHHLGLELTWSLIPLGLVTVIFFWGLGGYMNATVAPGDALEIRVTAKKWVWQFEYPNGTRTINEIHVPLGRAVKMVMISEDVIHSFYVPTFRIKQDVLPNRYTELWFQADVPGAHALLCAEYCGRGHSDMGGKIFVEDEAAYQNWLETGGDAVKSMPLAELGRLLYSSRGCEVCHSLDGTRKDGPSFKGVYGSAVPLAGGRTVMADDNYVRESILQPQAKLVAGYQPVMPTFQGLLREREINALVEFIKAQK